MLQISKVKADIENSKRYLDENASELKRSVINRHLKKISFLDLVFNYLQTTPDEKFIKKEVARLNNREKVIADGFEVWAETPHPQQFKSYKHKIKFYDKENGVLKIKTQLKALKFILNQ